MIPLLMNATPAVPACVNKNAVVSNIKALFDRDPWTVRFLSYPAICGYDGR